MTTPTTPATAGDGLLPCPFCGGHGIAHRVPTGWRVSCVKCDCQPRPGFPSDTEADAIAVWNTRLTPKPTHAETSMVIPIDPDTWTPHKAGDPMPCDGDAMVQWQTQNYRGGDRRKAFYLDWSDTACYPITHWRYAR